MAVLQTFYGKYYSDTNIKMNRTETLVSISPDSTTIWIADQPVDYNSMNPSFSKTCGGLLNFGGFTDPPSNFGLVSTKTTAYTGRQSLKDANPSQIGLEYNDGFLMYLDEAYRKCSDKNQRIELGSMFSFNDSSGQVHNLMIRCRNDNFFNGTGTTAVPNNEITYIFFQGNDLSNPTNIVSGTLTHAGANISSVQEAMLYRPVAVDATNKFIYATSFCSRGNYSSSNNDFWTQNVNQFFRIPYTTVPVDGTITLGTPLAVSLHTAGCCASTDSVPVFYCGLNNANEACFMSVVENEQSNTKTTTRSKATYLTRVLFDKYNPTTDTNTVITDVAGANGFTGSGASTNYASAYSQCAMSHFEASPIGVESDTYYAYYPCFNDVVASDGLGLLLLKWNKASDTFEVSTCSFTFPGATTFDDYLTYISRPVASSGLGTRGLLNAQITVSGGNYYLSMYYTHSTTADLASRTLQTEKNVLSFQIDSTDFSTLTYHSSSNFPVLSCVNANINNTKLLAIQDSSTVIYDWSNATGWGASATEAGIFTNVGQDQSGRFWGISVNSNQFSTLPNTGYSGETYKEIVSQLHILSSDLPSSVSIVFQDSTITYSGTTVSANLIVNAYDSSNNRVAKSVTLKITGNNAVFASNSGKTLTTTTSAGGDTTVVVSITGAGFVNISGSFAI